MNKNFCTNCDDDIPECAIVKLPQKISIDSLVSATDFTLQEYLVCHKNAQIIDNGLTIQNSCDECCLCQVTCKKYSLKWHELNINKLEKVIFSSFDKLAILIKGLFPELITACEVQVKGNFRTKRIDVAVRDNNTILLVKVLANPDKVPFYSRSYEEVKNYYYELFDLDIETVCLVPQDKKEKASGFGYTVITLDELLEKLGGA